MKKSIFTLSCCALLAMSPAAVSAKEPGDIFKQNSLRLIVSAGAGGGYAVYAQTLGRHMGRHLPNRPNIVIQHMPGAGGLRATTFMANTAPKDGTHIALVHTTAPFAPLYGMSDQFDPRQFNWLGTISTASGLCVAWHESPIKTWDDLFTKEYVVGGTGAGSQMETIPRLVNALFGTNIKIISGYEGGNNVYLAMERGEVHGRCGGLISSIRSTRPDWFPKKLVSIPIQIALERHPDFPDIPAIVEFAKDDRTRQMMEFAFANQDMDRPVFAPPGVSPDTVKMLRDAFMATMKDPAFLEDANKQNIDIDPRDGDHLAKVMARTFALPKDIVDEVTMAMKGR